MMPNDNWMKNFRYIPIKSEDSFSSIKNKIAQLEKENEELKAKIAELQEEKDD